MFDVMLLKGLERGLKPDLHAETPDPNPRFLKPRGLTLNHPKP